jgi:hypothetical protein
MGKGDCKTVYRWLLDDVVVNVQKEFLAANVDE